ncbi:Peptidyl-tRNA hydrolase [Gammaproteobacteria bacterium]|nr:Peptidyl-tRNA hydrolase [Gammaproteobacteria bacterium]
MKLIVGLGNPGKSYADTRHNAGWWVVDHLAGVWRFDAWRKDHETLVSDGRLGSQRVRLLKPQTYRNLSGSVLRPYLRREAWHADADLLIIVDEVALPVGRFRLRAQGSAGGHNGLKSIEAAVGSRAYARLRVGVGPPEGRERKGDLSEYVLDKAGKAERRDIEALFPELCSLAELWVREGAEAAMREYNRVGDGRRDGA